MKVLSVSFCTVEIEDTSGYRSSVFQQGDGRLKCQSSRCKSHNHFRCEHVQFVQSQHVTFPELPPLTEAELADIMDY